MYGRYEALKGMWNCSSDHLSDPVHQEDFRTMGKHFILMLDRPWKSREYFPEHICSNGELPYIRSFPMFFLLS